jgi:hypothetical protein
MAIIKLPTIVSSATPRPESFSIQSPNNAENAPLAPSSVPPHNPANASAMLQEASTQPQKNVNAVEKESGSTINAAALTTSLSGTVRIVSPAQQAQLSNQKINNATTVLKDLSQTQSLTTASQDSESESDSCSFVF